MKQHRLILGATFLATLWLGLPGVATAGPILYIDDSSNQLGTVDVGTGAVTVIGSMGADTMTDIAFSPTGQLYGVSFTNLYRINATTGAATLVGSLGLSDQNALVFGSDGTLYAAGNTSGDLYTVNTSTGHASLVGAIGFDSAGDLAFNNGNLYMSSTSNQLIRVNTATGAGTLVGNLGFSNVYGLATGDNGVLYGVSGTQIFSVNTTTGTGTLVLDYSGHGLGNANGTSFFSEAVPTPEPTTFTLLGIGAGSLVGYRWRRNRATSTRPVA